MSEQFSDLEKQMKLESEHAARREVNKLVEPLWHHYYMMSKIHKKGQSADDLFKIEVEGQKVDVRKFIDALRDELVSNIGQQHYKEGIERLALSALNLPARTIGDVAGPLDPLQ